MLAYRMLELRCMTSLAWNSLRRGGPCGATWGDRNHNFSGCDQAVSQKSGMMLGLPGVLDQRGQLLGVV
jgi:hypothetical protein